jgi:hypothetical protein
MSTIQEAQTKFDKLNAEAYNKLSALGISDETLMHVLRVVLPDEAMIVRNTDPSAGWSATWEKKTATTIELVITNKSSVKAVAYREFSSGGKVLSQGSRTVTNTAPSIDTYSRSAGWPFDTLQLTVRVGDPVNGPSIKVTKL